MVLEGGGLGVCLLRQRLVAVVLLGDGDAQEDELGQKDICK